MFWYSEEMVQMSVIQEEPTQIVMALPDSVPWRTQLSVSGKVGPLFLPATISIEWGDRAPTQITLDGNQTVWSADGITAPDIGEGVFNVTATLLDSGGNILDSDARSISIAKHPSNVSLDIPVMTPGDASFTVSGRVIDSLSGIGIQAAAVSIGLGSPEGSQQRLAKVVTGIGGIYSANITLPETVPDDPMIFSIYEGDQQYLPSETYFPIELEMSAPMTPVIRGITLGNQTVLLELRSNSEVSQLVLDEESRTLRFNLSGAADTGGQTTIEIGKVLEGPYTVFIDGEPTRNFTQSRDNVSGVTMLTVEYPEGASEIEVQGVRVVPEFPVLLGSILATALIPIVLIRLGKRTWFLNYKF
jgi:hypothetical protein